MQDLISKPTTDFKPSQASLQNDVVVSSIVFRFNNETQQVQQSQYSMFKLSQRYRLQSNLTKTVLITETTEAQNITTDYFDRLITQYKLEEYSYKHFLIQTDNIDLATKQLKKISSKLVVTICNDKLMIEKCADVFEAFMSIIHESLQSHFHTHLERSKKYILLQIIAYNIHLMAFQPKAIMTIHEHLQLMQSIMQSNGEYYQFGGRQKIVQTWLRSYKNFFDQIMWLIDKIVDEVIEADEDDISVLYSVQSQCHDIHCRVHPNFNPKSIIYAAKYEKQAGQPVSQYFYAINTICIIFQELHSKIDLRDYDYSQSLENILSHNISGQGYSSRFAISDEIQQTVTDSIGYSVKVNQVAFRCQEMLHEIFIVVYDQRDKMDVIRRMNIISDQLTKLNNLNQYKIEHQLYILRLLLFADATHSVKQRFYDYFGVCTIISEKFNWLNFIDKGEIYPQLTLQNDENHIILIKTIALITISIDEMMLESTKIFWIVLLMLTILEQIRLLLLNSKQPIVQNLMVILYQKLVRVQQYRCLPMEQRIRIAKSIKESIIQISLNQNVCTLKQLTQTCSINQNILHVTTPISLPIEFQIENNFIGSNVQVDFHIKKMISPISEFVDQFDSLQIFLEFQAPDTQQFINFEFDYKRNDKTSLDINAIERLQFDAITFPIIATLSKTESNPLTKFPTKKPILLKLVQSAIKLDLTLFQLSPSAQTLYLRPAQSKIEIQIEPLFDRHFCGQFIPIRFRMISHSKLSIPDVAVRFCVSGSVSTHFVPLKEGRIVDCRTTTTLQELTIEQPHESYKIIFYDLKQEQEEFFGLRCGQPTTVTITCDIVGESSVSKSIDIQQPYSLKIFKKPLYYVAEFESKHNIFISDILTQPDVDVFNLHDVLMRNLNIATEALDTDVESLVKSLLKTPTVQAFISILDSKVNKFDDPTVLSRNTLYRSQTLGSVDKQNTNIISKVSLDSAFKNDLKNRVVLVIFQTDEVLVIKKFLKGSGNEGLEKVFTQAVALIGVE